MGYQANFAIEGQSDTDDLVKQFDRAIEKQVKSNDFMEDVKVEAIMEPEVSVRIVKQTTEGKIRVSQSYFSLDPNVLFS